MHVQMVRHNVISAEISGCTSQLSELPADYQMITETLVRGEHPRDAVD
jgi:hypothetical protein